MHPSSPTSEAAPAPVDPMQSQVAYLDDVMAQAEIAANAERDLGTENPTAPSTRQEAPPAEAEDEGDESDESGPDDESQDDEDEDESTEEEGEQPQPSPTEQPKYSRRDAARFASELEAAKRDLEQTRSQLEQHRGHLAHVTASDKAIRNHLQQQSGYVKEGNGRFRYENLSEKVLKGTATTEEAEEVAQMTQWHEFAAPIFRAAEEMVASGFATDWAKLRDLKGIGEEGFGKLNAAPNSIAAARELHTMAYAAGAAEAKSELNATIAKLKAEVKSLKTARVASAPQPASANGAGVPSKGSVLSRAIDPKTGLSNPDFDREVAAGKWLGVDLAAQN